MTNVEANISGVDALKLVQTLKVKIRFKDDERKWKDSDHASFDRVELYEMLEAVDKLEKRLQWSV